MKILKLRFKNLNSLYDEWIIDFSAPEYTGNGIFAITGPTGAGKSTILDAICLALYGATPRLGKITKSGNEIMSRQTGECYAEVVFKSQAGEFICNWSQHRARKKPDGNLIDSKHEISDAKSGKILESKKSKVAGVIENKTGMNFERFTRSILLAQGGFDVFLQAAPDEKAPILEQITGTEIYGNISKRVHERRRDESEALNLLQAETSGITILTKEQEAELTDNLTEKQKSETEINTKYKEIEKSILWLNKIDSLRIEITDLSEQAEKLNTDIKNFKPEREKLTRSQKAAELEGGFATLSLTRKQQESDKNLLEKYEKQLPQIQTLVSQKEDRLKNAEKSAAKAEEEQKDKAPLLQQVRTLDQQISDTKNRINEDKTDCEKVIKQIADHKIKLDKAKDKLKAAQKDLKLINEYLASNAKDESLVTQLAGIKEQINNLQSVLQDILTKKESLSEAEKQFKSASKNLTACNKKLTTCKQKLTDAHNQIALKKMS